MPAPVAHTPQMLGVDEWAYRRGHRYGTILVDLETGKPVDLLPDHQATTFETWLKEHPGVRLISRDRAGDFARGATLGAPEAIQSADRFHVVMRRIGAYSIPVDSANMFYCLTHILYIYFTRQICLVLLFLPVLRLLSSKRGTEMPPFSCARRFRDQFFSPNL